MNPGPGAGVLAPALRALASSVAMGSSGDAAAAQGVERAPAVDRSLQTGQSPQEQALDVARVGGQHVRPATRKRSTDKAPVRAAVVRAVQTLHVAEHVGSSVDAWVQVDEVDLTAAPWVQRLPGALGPAGGIQ